MIQPQPDKKQPIQAKEEQPSKKGRPVKRSKKTGLSVVEEREKGFKDRKDKNWKKQVAKNQMRE